MNQIINRRQDGMPQHECEIYVYVDKRKVKCKWKPFDQSKYSEDDMPQEGYLGTAFRIDSPYFGYHAWLQNNSEFIYYQMVVEYITGYDPYKDRNSREFNELVWFKIRRGELGYEEDTVEITSDLSTENELVINKKPPNNQEGGCTNVPPR